jgi:hypothetical protein
MDEREKHERRIQLAVVAESLMAIWEGLPYDEEDGDWWPKGGVVTHLVKGGYTQGRAIRTWNEIVADIFANEKFGGNYEKAKAEEDVLGQGSSAERWL